MKFSLDIGRGIMALLDKLGIEYESDLQRWDRVGYVIIKVQDKNADGFQRMTDSLQAMWSRV